MRHRAVDNGSGTVLKIGSLTLISPVMLSPMAGVSDLPFRIINRRFGCGLAFAEMISARALTYRNSNTLKMLSTNPADRPLGLQLLGNDSKIMLKALDILRDYEFDVLDINAACPVSKVTKRGEGSAMLRQPRTLFEVLKAVVDHSHLPVTVKIRSGWDESSVNARDVALYAQEAGVSAVFIHGRTRSQGYSGSVDYDEIRKVKEALTIPVIASGDAFSAELIRNIFDVTGCDGVAVARGALGNPWIFDETVQYLKNGTVPARPSIGEIVDTMIIHLDLSVEADGDVAGTTKFRKLFAWYVKGLRDTRDIRTEAFRAETRPEMLALINKLRNTSYRSAAGRFS
jgi:tRNA-dihydrouridine synthase B